MNKSQVKLVFIVVITIVFIIATFFLASLGLHSNPDFLSVYFSILTSIATIFLGQLVKESYEDMNIEKLVVASKDTLITELRRNFCTAELFAKSLLSTMAWDNVVSCGIALKLKDYEYKPLMDCYSAIKFYNHDVSESNFGEVKQERIKKFILEALKAIDSESPSHDVCCKDILPEWATKEKLDKACKDRLEQLKADTTTK